MKLPPVFPGAACFALTFAICGCSQREGEDKAATASSETDSNARTSAIDTGFTATNKASLSAIQPGMSLSEVRAKLNSTERHFFTCEINSDVYLFVEYYIGLSNRPKSMGLNFGCLFKNNFLKSVLNDVPRREGEDYAYEGTTASRTKPWDLNDESLMLKTIQVVTDVYSGIAGVLDGVRECEAWEDAHSVQPQFPPWQVFKLAPPYLTRQNRAYAKNKELAKIFDGTRIKIGDKPEDVKAILGNPVVDTVYDGLRFQFFGKRVYGNKPDVDLEMNSLYMFSPIAVVFKDGLVSRVYGRQWISRSWVPDAVYYGL